MEIQKIEGKIIFAEGKMNILVIPEGQKLEDGMIRNLELKEGIR